MSGIRVVDNGDDTFNVIITEITRSQGADLRLACFIGGPANSWLGGQMWHTLKDVFECGKDCISKEVRGHVDRKICTLCNRTLREAEIRQAQVMVGRRKPDSEM
jgi:hypothetical protein